MIIKKKDISSILPTIIKIIKEILELVNKLAKLMFFIPNNSIMMAYIKDRIAKDSAEKKGETINGTFCRIK